MRKSRTRRHRGNTKVWVTNSWLLRVFQPHSFSRGGASWDRICVPGDFVSAPFVRVTTNEKGIVAVSPRDLLFSCGCWFATRFWEWNMQTGLGLGQELTGRVSFRYIRPALWQSTDQGINFCLAFSINYERSGVTSITRETWRLNAVSCFSLIRICRSHVDVILFRRATSDKFGRKFDFSLRRSRSKTTVKIFSLCVSRNSIFMDCHHCELFWVATVYDSYFARPRLFYYIVSSVFLSVVLCKK